MEIEFKVDEKAELTIVHFDLRGAITPEELKKLKPPKVKGTKGVVLSGRGPIWLYCYLMYCYHPTRFIATYDPRVGGAVIVESHSQNHKVGEILEVDVNEL
jgi:CRISPR-associated protein Csx3